MSIRNQYKDISRENLTSGDIGYKESVRNINRNTPRRRDIEHKESV
ncbi:hypothetical protein J27TS7_02290 [Paenibacillus dendritiformis]|nr:hypothetical protein J27TS7_02290 [Paenibacillus dendritiformis]